MSESSDGSGDKKGKGRRSRRRRGRRRRRRSKGNPQTNGNQPSVVVPPEVLNKPFTPPTLEELYAMRIFDEAREGHGFLRDPQNRYCANSRDAYVSKQLARRHHLRDGVLLDGVVGSAQRRGQNPRLAHVTCIGGVEPSAYLDVPEWRHLTVVDPARRIKLSEGTDDVTLRIIDLLCPIGFGQRGLLVAPPRTGKTMILQKISHAIQQNHPDAYLIILLVDERPEEATAMRRATKQGEVAASTNDRGPASHIRLTETVLKKCKRMVEAGRDVVVLMDSLTRLGRAYNMVQKGRGRTLSGGVDAQALEKPKFFFGAARNVEGGGSLTILATALIDTGSKMDQVIFEEFKGTGNMELVLDRKMADKRIFPAIDIYKSGTRKEEKLLAPAVLEKVHLLRRVLDKLKPEEGVELLIDRLKRCDANEEFLARLTG